MSVDHSHINLSLESFLHASEPKVPAVEIVYVSTMLGMSMPELLGSLEFPIEDVIQRVSKRDVLTVEESKLLLGVFRIIRRIQAISYSSFGPSYFDPAIWLAIWMRETVPALDHATPSTYLSTLERQAVLENLLDCAVSGAYR